MPDPHSDPKKNLIDLLVNRLSSDPAERAALVEILGGRKYGSLLALGNYLSVNTFALADQSELSARTKQLLSGFMSQDAKEEDVIDYSAYPKGSYLGVSPVGDRFQQVMFSPEGEILETIGAAFQAQNPEDLAFEREGNRLGLLKLTQEIANAGANLEIARGNLGLRGEELGLGRDRLAGEMELGRGRLSLDTLAEMFDQQLSEKKFALDKAQFDANEAWREAEKARLDKNFQAEQYWKQKAYELDQQSLALEKDYFGLAVKKQEFAEQQAFANLSANPRNFRELEALQFLRGGNAPSGGTPIPRLISPPSEATGGKDIGGVQFNLSPQEELMQAGKPFKPMDPLPGQLRLPSLQQFRGLNPSGQQQRLSTFSTQGIPDEDVLYQIRMMSRTNAPRKATVAGRF